MQAAAAAIKKIKSIKYFIKALERRREKILKLKNQNIAELKINKTLAGFNFNSVFCNLFLFSSLSLKIFFLENTVNKSSGASPDSKDSQ